MTISRSVLLKGAGFPEVWPRWRRSRHTPSSACSSRSGCTGGAHEPDPHPPAGVEFLQLRRDPLLLRLLLLMPIIQLVGFGYVSPLDVRNLPTAVVDLDQTVVSRQLESSFTASGYFLVVARPDAET